MAWTYSGDPASSDKDAVRFLILDTDTNRQLLSNEEINYLLADENSHVLFAAARAAEQVSATFSKKAGVQVGDLKLDFGKTSAFYTSKAQELRREGSIRGASPFAGGRLISDKDAETKDTDRVPPFARRNLTRPFANNDLDDESRYGK